MTDTSTGGGNNMGVLGDSGAVVYSDGVSFPYVEYEATVNCVPGATFGAARVASAGLVPPAAEGQSGALVIAGEPKALVAAAVAAPAAAAVPAEPRGAVAGAAVAALAAAPAAQNAAAAPAVQNAQAPGSLPSAGGEPFSVAGQSGSTMLMAAVAIAMMGAAVAVTWAVGRKQED